MHFCGKPRSMCKDSGVPICNGASPQPIEVKQFRPSEHWGVFVSLSLIEYKFMNESG
jgi:hypothetical protein